MTKKQQNNQAELDALEKSNKIMFLIGIIIILVFALHMIGDNQEEQENVQVSKTLGATYYTDSGVYIRFDSTDQNQIRLVQQIEMICKANNFRNCMNAKDSLGIKE